MIRSLSSLSAIVTEAISWAAHSKRLCLGQGLTNQYLETTSTRYSVVGRRGNCTACMPLDMPTVHLAHTLHDKGSLQCADEAGQRQLAVSSVTAVTSAAACWFVQHYNWAGRVPLAAIAGSRQISPVSLPQFPRPVGCFTGYRLCLVFSFPSGIWTRYCKHYRAHPHAIH